MRTRKAPEHPFNADSTTVPAWPELLTSSETAALLRISKKTLQRYSKKRLINFVALAGKVLFRRSAVELFLAQREVKATAVGR